MRSFLLIVAAIVPSFVAGCSCSDTNALNPDSGSPPRDAATLDGATPPPDAALPAGAMPPPDAALPDGATPPPDSGRCADADGDGTTDCAGDCNDADPLTSPTAAEICGDMLDNDCDMMTDEGCTGGLGTYVSALTGVDTNPGTRAMPVQTIRQGMMNAMTLGLPQTVVVAQGMYPEKVTMVEGIQLVGGHQCTATSCTWASDPAMYPADIQNTDFEGILAGAGVTRATRIENFHVSGRSGTASPPGSAGITLRGGSPTLRGNTIVAGNVSGGGFAADRSVGIELRSTTDPAGALIEGNDITGGTSTGLSTAVFFDWYMSGGVHALATVQGNVLRGGTGQRSAGLSSFNAAPGTLVTDNDIFAGPSMGGSSVGIEVGGTLTIDANRINADPARTGACTAPTAWCAGIFSESSTTTITNNVVFGSLGPRSAAVFLGEFEIPAGAIVLNGNLLDGGGSGPGSSPTRSAAVVVSIGTCMTCGFRGQGGRMRHNILLGGNNSSRFGVLEDPSAGRSMRPEVLENNLFHFAPAAGRTDVLYRQMSVAGVPLDHTTVATINVLTMPPATMNISGDPLVDPATRHLMPGSPCINAGTATEAPPVDFEGDARPAGAAVDIGPDET